ncbi:hypothetical protein KPL71_008375 [Citrus sinensis]|uniref:Uncharacterized protein n=1 Tax=Citrus sinensis TaxID=2711 RepID=A0ACB8M706_CITSI|nr:hypothetical protein KPL71_008375 [Citrus sinensis]
MDKSWLKYDRLSDEYEVSVENFIKTAVESNQEISVVRCPCDKCRNLAFHRPKEVKDHLIIWGFDMSYKTWVWHGEDICNKSPDNIGCQNDSGYMDYDSGNTVEMVEDALKDCDSDPKAFKKLLEDSEKPLYPGSNKFTKLSALVKLYNIKGRYGWSDSSFLDLLSALSDMLPEGNDLPVSMYEAKKTMSALGLEYIKIHACPNDCILYRKEYESPSNCPTCGESRWKKKDASVAAYRKGVPAKVLWYFPPIPRFRRLFQSSQTAKDLTWHINEREINGKLRHPADSPAWKLVDEKWPTFALEPRNLRLALSADGINPHSSLSSTYSCWPILLVTYNLPPWLCMKRKFMMLSLLISGPQQPDNDIDVYLAPLIEDLQTLWDVGVEAYDAYKKEFFNLRAVLLWTINDFLAYGNLAGCTVKGYYACPYCVNEVRLCGPVYLKWMYPFERNMKDLKAYVRNRNNPEGCIVESYIAEEALEFCAEYVSNMRTIGLPPGHVETSSIDKPLLGGKFEQVDHSLIHQVHLYVLQNTEEVWPFISEHIEWLKGHHSQKAKNERWLSNEHNHTFSTWLNKKVYEMIDDDEDVSNILRWLSQGPRPFVVKHPGYDINGSNLMDKGKGLAYELSNEESIDYSGNEEVPDEDNSRDEEVPEEERFIVHPNSKKQVFQALGSAFRNFKYLLTTKYILPHKHNRKRLKRPPFQYSHIPQNVWDKFVNSRLSTEFERIRRQQQNKRANNKWNHRLSRKGYDGLLDEICSETGLVETEVDRSVAWKRARKMKNGEYDPDVDSVVKKIDALEEKAKKREFKANARNDILARSIGRPATSRHMQGVGKFISPKMYFDTPNNSFQMRQERLNILERLDKQEAELSDLKKKIKKQPRHSDVGSSNFPLDEQTIEDEAEEMTARNEDKSIGMTRNGSPAKKKHETLTKKRQSPRKMNESAKKQVTADCPGDKLETPTKRQSPRKKTDSPKQQVIVDCPRET